MYDECIKIMFANPNKLEPLTLLLSRILEVRYEDLEGRITLETPFIPNKQLAKKKTERDIVVKIMSDKRMRVVIEVNVRNSGYDIILNRNLYYLDEVYTSSLENGENYNQLDWTLLINFNTFYSDNSHKKIFDYYYFRNDEGHILTDKQKILNINIDRCYKLWYNKNVPIFRNTYEQDLFYICAAMVTKSEEEFNKCLSMLKTRSNIKTLIEEVSEDMNQNEGLKIRYYDFMEETKLINESILDETKDKGREEGRRETKKEMIINFYKNGVPLELISKASSLPKEKVREIIDSAK